MRHVPFQKTKRRTPAGLAVLVVLASLMLAAGEAGQTASVPSDGVSADSAAAAPARMAAAYGRLPLTFEPNFGQVDEHVDFLARGSGYTLFLTSAGAVLALRQDA